MAAENIIISANAILIALTCPVYGIFSVLPQSLSIRIAWYSTVPVAILYGLMLLQYSKSESIKLPDRVKRENGGRTVKNIKMAITRLSHRIFRSSATNLDYIEEPPATWRTCVASMLCTLVTEFIALSYIYQSYQYCREVLMEQLSLTLCTQLFAAAIAWMCYTITIFVFELEVLDLYHQRKKFTECI